MFGNPKSFEIEMDQEKKKKKEYYSKLLVGWSNALDGSRSIIQIDQLSKDIGHLLAFDWKVSKPWSMVKRLTEIA